MDDILAHYKTYLQSSINSLKEELKSIRTGRANPALIESIIVEAYGGSAKMKLLELSAITTDGASALVVTPYDASTASDIERAILKSPLGFNPQNQGNKIIVRIPPLSEEQRQKYLKVVSQTIEEKKVSIRNERDSMRKKIKALHDAKTVTDDEKFRGEKEIDTMTTNSGTEITTIKEHKEKEIMEV